MIWNSFLFAVFMLWFMFSAIVKLVKLVCLKSLLPRRTLSDPAETGKNNPHYRSGEGGFGGIHSMD